MAGCPKEVAWVGQAAGRQLQEGLADVTGALFASSRRAAADRDGNGACGGVAPDGVPPTRGCASADEKSGLRQGVGLGFPSLLSSKRLRIVKAPQGGRLRGERRSQRAQLGSSVIRRPASSWSSIPAG